MFDNANIANGLIMAQRMTTQGGVADTKDRRNVAVKLTTEELKQYRQWALDTDSSSIEIMTDLLRKGLREHLARRK
jgi:hypothetical protein